MPGTNEKKLALAVGVLCACALIAAVGRILSARPSAVEWSGIAESFTDDDPAQAEITLELERHAPLFGKVFYTGSVTVNGRRYEDIHGYEYPKEPFIPAEMKADFGGCRLDVYRDCVILEEYGNKLRVGVLKGRGPHPVYEIGVRG